MTTKGELIEVDDICPSLDFCVLEIEYITLMTPDKLTLNAMFKAYAKRGYKINSWEDSKVFRVTQQLHTNVVAYLTLYINGFTMYSRLNVQAGQSIRISKSVFYIIRELLHCA